MGGGAQDCRSNGDEERGENRHVGGGARRFEPGTGVEFPSVFLVTIQNRVFSLLDFLHSCISSDRLFLVADT